MYKKFDCILSLTIVILLWSAVNPTFAQNVVKNKNAEETKCDFEISLAQWSLRMSFLGSIKSREWYFKMLEESPDSLLNGELEPIDFPKAAADLGIYSIEILNIFYLDKTEDMEYWNIYKQKCDEVGVKIGLIMCDAIGNLGDSDSISRMTAVENYYKWIDIANFLDARSIRVFANGVDEPKELAANMIHSLSKLGEYGMSKGVNVLVENHGGYSSNGAWLSEVIRNVDRDNIGTLPDFGNFCLEWDSTGCIKEYDMYKGMYELMPFAKGVSAKSYNFDENGNEIYIDFYKMMKIVKESGYKGYIGIEYEGKQLSEIDGIKATKLLLEKVFREL